MKRFLLLTGWLLLAGQLAAGPAVVDSVKVRTKAKNNSEVAVFYRIPKDYNPADREYARILVLFGGRNSDGRSLAAGGLGFGEWADRLGIVLVSPGFKDDDYWEPKAWSGKALFDAISLIKKKYRVCDAKLLYYGYSAGSQAANLFPHWKPEATRAWVSHACGVFFEPGNRMRGVPGLVSCGDADYQRFRIAHRFVMQNRRFGVNILWMSLPNSPHDVPPESLRIARAFLEYYHLRHPEDLGANARYAGRVREEPILFVGDDQEKIFYPVNSPGARNIFPEDRVFFPAREIADAWGRPARSMLSIQTAAEGPRR